MANKVRPELVTSWIVNNPELVYDEASGIIFCTKCETSFKATKKGNVDRHINGAIHQGLITMKFLSNITVMEGAWSVEGVVRRFTEEVADDEPFHLMDLGEVVRRFQCWKNVMPRVEPFYAVKCNDDAMLVRTLAALGAGFDCASRQEIDLVTGLGVAPERIIYAHATKMASHMRHAARAGVATTTFDSSDELTKVQLIMPHAKLVLRIRCDAKVAQVSLGTKFGCDPVNEAPRLLRMASELALEVIGVSFHVGSGAEELAAYARGLRHCAALFRAGAELGLRMRLVDIGGGYPGLLTSSINQVAAVINKALVRYFPDDSVRVIAEPGQYFACAASTLVACVFAKRQILKGEETHTMYYISEGVYGSFMDCILYDAQPSPLLVKPINAIPESSSLWGPTCDPIDCVLRSTLLPPLPIGTWLMFRNMGAYTRSLATTFNGFKKAEVRYIVDESIWSTLKDTALFRDIDFAHSLISKHEQQLPFKQNIQIL